MSQITNYPPGNSVQFTSPTNNDKKNQTQVSLPKIVTAGLSGLAGGVVIATVFVGTGGIAAVVGSLVGAAITGSAEYRREKKKCWFCQRIINS